jgi:hypothetical protein
MHALLSESFGNVSSDRSLRSKETKKIAYENVGFERESKLGFEDVRSCTLKKHKSGSPETLVSI